MMGISQNKACMIKIPILPKEAPRSEMVTLREIGSNLGKQTVHWETTGTFLVISRYLALGEAEGAKEDFRKLLVPSPYQAVLKPDPQRVAGLRRSTCRI